MQFGDFNWYASAPGESYDNLSGRGWVLAGGAKLVPTTLYDGKKGYVLDMPAGSTAVSPAMCVTNAYPTARSMVRDVAGSAGVSTFVSYIGARVSPFQGTGTLRGSSTGFGLSSTVNIHPNWLVGWQLARFELVAAGTGSEYQIYNFFVDPRMF